MHKHREKQLKLLDAWMIFLQGVIKKFILLIRKRMSNTGEKPTGDRKSLSSGKYAVIFPRGKLLHSSPVARQKPKETTKSQVHQVQLGIAIAEQVIESQPAFLYTPCMPYSGRKVFLSLEVVF